MFERYGIVVGKKAICEYLGCSWSTVRKKKRLYGLPVRVFPPGVPCIITTELFEYIRIYTAHIEGSLKSDENTGKTSRSEMNRILWGFDFRQYLEWEEAEKEWSRKKEEWHPISTPCSTPFGIKEGEDITFSPINDQKRVVKFGEKW